METIDTYIYCAHIHIYRRDMNEPRNIAGLVEIVGSDEKKVFGNQHELCEILIEGKKRPRQCTDMMKENGME